MGRALYPHTWSVFLLPNMELCMQLYQSIHLIYLEIQICVTLLSKTPKPASMGYYISPRPETKML